VLIVAHDGYPRGVESGADFVEIDVRRDRDGTIVVAHDVPKAGGGHPTLDEVLRRVGGEIGLQLDLKEPGYEGELIERALAHSPPDKLAVTSGLEDSIREVKRRHPEIRAGLTVGRRRPIDNLAPDFLAVDQRYRDQYRDVDLPIWVWTVDDKRAMRRYLAEDGVEAIITNRPEVAVRLRTGRS
jgi:glycerophosphoryl diester phosphodiesterase